MSCGQRIAVRLRAWRLVIATFLFIYIALVLLYQYEYERILSLMPLNRPKVTSILYDNSSLHLQISRHVFTNSTVDIHLEDSEHGHTGEVQGNHEHSLNSDRIQIAIGGGITSSKLKGITEDNIAEKLQFFFTLFPSFCKSATPGFDYHFYLAYDHVDTVFSNPALLQAFHEHFKTRAKTLCSAEVASSLSLHFVQCSHHKKPAWAQNDAMMEAYIDDVDYFYRVNDDSDLKSVNWTPEFIKTLDKYNPPKVGVVGPKHRGGNTAILTYDFVHRTHVDIFGFYYPRTFTDWYADDWVTKVYRPDRSTKMSSIQVVHTMKLGQRYGTTWGKGKELPARLARDQATLKRYIQAKNQSPERETSGHTKLIVMSLCGSDPEDTMGVIRNAQLLPVFFPEWTLRVYVANAENANSSLVVPVRILTKLRRLGAQIAYVDIATLLIPHHHWSYLAADDASVDVFIVRSPRGRLSDRDAAAVQLWLLNWQPFHCIRDHPSHGDVAISHGLWGARTAGLRGLLKAPLVSLLQPGTLQSVLEKAERWVEGADFLNNLLWPLVEAQALCHDSVSCTKWNGADPFPVPRTDPADYVGRAYDSHQDPVKKEDITSMAECVGRREPQGERTIDT